MGFYDCDGRSEADREGLGFGLGPGLGLETNYCIEITRVCRRGFSLPSMIMGGWAVHASQQSAGRNLSRSSKPQLSSLSFSGPNLPTRLRLSEPRKVTLCLPPSLSLRGLYPGPPPCASNSAKLAAAHLFTQIDPQS